MLGLFGYKKLKIDSNITVWLRKLSLSDFLGSEYVPISGYSIISNDRGSRSEEDDQRNKTILKDMFEKAIVKVRGMDKDRFIVFCLKNDALCGLLYNYIYFVSCKKKISYILRLTKKLQ